MLRTPPKAPAKDKERLIDTVDQALDSWATYAPYLNFFGSKLRRSHALPAHEVPADVITMNSRFALRNEETGDTVCYTLVYPEDEAPHRGRLSVLSPMGMALYGARVGDAVCWRSAKGPEVATVQRLIYQPEAAGDWDR